MIAWFIPLVFFPLVYSFRHWRRHGIEFCGQYDSIPAGDAYEISTNLWGSSGATGRQCSKLESVADNTVKWSTKWEWEGGDGVKSYSHVELNSGINKKLSTTDSMPTTWVWSLDITDNATTVADVAYDFFTSDAPGGDALNEIMVWLAHFRAEPISFDYDPEGKSVPIASNLEIDELGRWDLYLGSNNFNKVYSFLPSSGIPIHSFEGDMYSFFKYLINAGYVRSSEYLTTAHAGPEATCGSAHFKTSAYSLAIY